MTTRYDMHCHLDFAENYNEIAREAAESIVMIDATVIPSSFVSANARLAEFPNMHVALGIHPWWVADGRVGEADVDRFKNLVPETGLIGEIGLDYAKDRRESRTRQLGVMAEALQAIESAGGGRALFLHAVRAYEDIFMLLEREDALDSNTVVFHWFSGTPQDFGRACDAGCWFSVGMRMLATDAGRLFAAEAPADRLLAETDNPTHEGMEWNLSTWEQEIDNTIKGIAEVRGVPVEEMAGLLAENSKRLLEMHA